MANNTETAQVRTIEIAAAAPFYKDNRAADIRDSISKAVAETAPSGQPEQKGVRVPHPFDFTAVAQFKSANPYHSTCLETKTAATTGINFHDAKQKEELPDGTYKWKKQESKVAKLTRGLCNGPFISQLNAACEEFWNIGVGYLEVVRDAPGGAIVGIHHLASRRVFKFLESDGINYHYEIDADGHGDGRSPRFAAFGDSKDFVARNGELYGIKDDTRISEVICFAVPSSQSKHYGVPGWVSAVQPIELIQCILQYKYDFFQNRGVPEFMLFITGQQVDDDTWEEIESALQANIGLGNSHKTLAVNLSNPEVKVQVEKLAMDNKLQDEISATSDDLAQMIVSAHRVPPLLAGIQIPGKLGATNELPNALAAFQKLVIDGAQYIFQETLGLTLGDDDDGIDGLGMDDFAFSSILDEFDLNKMDTVSRMREPAVGSNRDLDAGVKE